MAAATMEKVTFTTEVLFPAATTFDGRVFYPTGKIGHVIATGKRSREYAWSDARIERRVWVDEDGRQMEE